MRRLSALIFLLGACLPAAAWATCTSSGPLPVVLTFSFTPGSFNPAVANGTVLYSQNIFLSSIPTVSCSNTSRQVQYRGVGQAGPYNTFPSSVAGVGLRISSLGPTTAWPYSGTAPGDSWSAQPALLIEMVKTGPITAGGVIPAGEVGQIWQQSNIFPNWQQIYSIALNTSVEVKPTVPTCSVTNPSQTVWLGKVSQAVFTGPGSTSRAEPFGIGLNCTGGSVGAVTSIYATLTDQTNPANTTADLSLTPASTARGVAIQIRRGTTVLGYGPDSKAAGNVNQWYAGQTGNGAVDIPLTANYVQTGQVVSPGTANGRVTFTMSYQ